jgi:glycosyltransferase involved in cell wall biosynthesis
MEHSVSRKVDAIYYPSNDETEHVRTYLSMFGLPTPCHTLPMNAFDSFEEAAAENLSQRHGLLFVGGFRHDPNKDGVQWFVKEVWPIVIARSPDMFLYLCGSNPPDEVKALASRRIVVTGFIPDEALREYYRTAKVSIAPLRYGAGVKGKGIPVVTTSVGAQGLDAGVLSVSDDPAVFADLICELVENDLHWKQQSSHQLAYVKSNYSVEGLRHALALSINPEM